MANKRGIAWPLENKQDSPHLFANAGVGWFYNWSSEKRSDVNLHFVPMYWSASREDPTQFVNKVRSQGAKVILGFNEPERGEQANMSPGDAARVWKQHIEPLANEGIRLGSPSIASTEAGLNWLQAFFNAGCRVDFLALHWYGVGVDNFIHFITKARERFGNKPVWVTEFACTSWNQGQPISQEEINNFFNQSINRLDGIDWIERYAWFGATRHLDAALGSGNCLISSQGTLSELGKIYVNGGSTIGPSQGSRVVALRSNANNKFVCADNFGNNPLIANRDEASDWEKFDLVRINGNEVALKSHANGQYVCAEDGGNGPLIANRSSVDGWETFTMIDRGNGKVAFKAVNGKFVCADDYGNRELAANRDSADAWETFDLV
ncbi:unnamed protein product [Rotaria magnacalcarata]|uniref:Asl1-like glycosyl hydrolase catalytic domain-containing protein n=1 Tax=Rotaria magnacalcarata TaxID=392030 RepID=A0A816MXK0_9BILA|nr:unnamed protein product [Rotaria magnacalcarata]CAF2116255.1 unnamed protein product [Rotaria magnacalcarata]CAF4263985.1 unnamed protein product [Rotaria magnacalcarata]CAF4276325.1 unnamed protein product [Rotaria magnacalcarata]